MFEFVFYNLTGFFLAFIPALFSFSLVAYISFSLPRNQLVNVFAILTLSAGIWQIGEAISIVSGNPQMADFWESFFSIGWIFIGPVCLHFSLLYSRLISHNAPHWLLGLLYIPTFILSRLYQSHIYKHVISYDSFWGWNTYHSTGFLDAGTVYWTSACVVVSCIILIRYSYSIRKVPLLFAQSMLITTGVFIPTVGGIVTEVIFPFFFDKPAVPTTPYLLSLLSLVTIVALKKYRLFSVSDLINSEMLLHELPTIVISISNTEHITYINKSGMDLLGIKKENLKNARYDKMMIHAAPEHKANFNRAYVEAVKGIHLDNVESSFVVGERTINVMISACPIVNNNKIRGVLLSIRDITELKTSIQLSLQNEISLKEAQRLSHIGSWELNTQDHKIKWSDELYRIYGLDPQSVVNLKTLLKSAHPEDKQNVKQQIEFALQTHQPIDFNYRVIIEDGQLKYLNAKLQMANIQAARFPVLLGTVQDITSQVEFENSLQQKNRQLQQSNNNLEEFVFIASHDLKEPVRKITTFTEMLLDTEGNNLSEKSRSYFQRIAAASQRMQTMIDDLLSLSVISRNNKFGNHDLQAVFNEATIDLDLKIKEKNAIINLERLPSVYVNPEQFKQLFQNLISNSLKFARQDVTPTINVKSSLLNANEIEELSLIKGNRYLKISLEDNGIGFENAYSEKIFQMFQRLHGKVHYEGTGIGLAVCKKVVENHKGIIKAYGIPNEGATFIIIIPVGHKNFVTPVFA